MLENMLKTVFKKETESYEQSPLNIFDSSSDHVDWLLWTLVTQTLEDVEMVTRTLEDVERVILTLENVEMVTRTLLIK